MSVQPSIKNVKVGGSMVAKPVNVLSGGIWKPVQNIVAELYLTPRTGSFTTIGGTVTVMLRENSLTNPVNSFQANISYSSSVLQFQSSDQTGSLFEVSLQNTGGSGTIQISAASFDGNVTGDQLLSTITFTVLTHGTATLAFTTGSGVARASDSTNICNQQLGATFTT